MGVLEQVIQMRNQGMPDPDIFSQLQEQGFNPGTINDALNQANIKGAVGNGMEEINPTQYNDDFVPSPQEPEGYSPTTQEYAEDIYVPQVQTQPRQYAYPGPASQEYTYQGSYPEEQYAGTDADTMVEIAQQVFTEKIKKIQQQIEDLNEFKTLYQTKVDGIYERLKRIESIIDRLQSAILEKVGSYGAGIESVKKELSMMQGTYGKIVNAVADKKEHHTQQHHTESPQHHASERHPLEHKTHYQTSHPSKSRKKKH